MSTHELCNHVVDSPENRNSHFSHRDTDSERFNSSIFADPFNEVTFSKVFNDPKIPKLQKYTLSNSSRIRQPYFLTHFVPQ